MERILPVVSYGCESWSLILREKVRPMMRRRCRGEYFNPNWMKEQEARDASILVRGLHNLCSSPIIK
jgi:hypothetical protein